jgi:hypothetical protein
MKRLDIKVGKVYGMKLAGSIQPVRIERDRGLQRTTMRHMKHLGWDGVKLNSSHQFHVKAAKKILCEMVKLDGHWYPRESAEGLIHGILKEHQSA